MRKADISRKTRETDITVSLVIDGNGESNINTGIGFFDHMLDQLAKHGLFDLGVKAVGDLNVDAHHTVEDVGIVIGQALKDALGDKKSIKDTEQQLFPWMKPWPWCPLILGEDLSLDLTSVLIQIK